MSANLRPLPAIRPASLCGLWTITLTASVLYCWLYEYAHGRPIGDLLTTIRWSLEAWVGWIFLSTLFALRVPLGGRLARLWLHPYGWVVILFCTPLIAVVCDWYLRLLFTSMGWSYPRGSFWVLFYERLPWSFAGSGCLGALSWFSAHRYKAFSAAPITATPPPPAVPPTPTLRIATPAGPTTIAATDIEAIIAAENYVEVCMGDGKRYLHRATLQSVGDALQTPSLIRVRRSAIVNMDHVRSRMPGWRLKLTSGRIVPIGRTYRTQFEASCQRTVSTHQHVNGH